MKTEKGYNISVGKRRCGFFGDNKYYIEIEGVKHIYNSEYIFWCEFFKVSKRFELSRREEMILGLSVGD